jgi:hypothetical protein
MQFRGENSWAAIHDSRLAGAGPAAKEACEILGRHQPLSTMQLKKVRITRKMPSIFLTCDYMPYFPF